MADVWITCRQLARLTGWTPGYARRLLRDAKCTHKLSAECGRNGKYERQYLTSDLPLGIRERLEGKSLVDRARSLAREFAEFVAELEKRGRIFHD